MDGPEGMRKHPAVSGRPSVEQCLCNADLGYLCSLHRDGTPPETIDESDTLSIDRPWNPDTLPEHLRGYGHRVADQDGGTGEEWLTPEQDKEGEFMRAVGILFDAKEAKS